MKRHAEGVAHVALAVSLALAGGLSQVGPASADTQTRSLRPVQSSPQTKAPDARTSDGKSPDGKSSEGTTPEAKPPGAHRGDREKSKPDRAAVPRPASIKTLAQKTKVLADLHERLVAADSAEAAEVVADTIEQMWLYSGSDTTNLLMERAMK
ncbi:MAG: hypothetical protein ABL907_16205, partial [Hyphomicrobium sp.]